MFKLDEGNDLEISYKWHGFGLKGQRSTLGLWLTAIRRGFELYECLPAAPTTELQPFLYQKILKLHSKSISIIAIWMAVVSKFGQTDVRNVHRGCAYACIASVHKSAAQNLSNYFSLGVRTSRRLQYAMQTLKLLAAAAAAAASVSASFCSAKCVHPSFISLFKHGYGFVFSSHED